MAYQCAMREPSVRTSRLAIAGGFSAALAVAAAGFLIGRATIPSQPQAAPAPLPAAAPAEPASDDRRLLSRGDIASAAREAADALASGTQSPTTLRDLSGRRFLLSLPFGCVGPAGPDSPAQLRWRYDDAAEALRVHVALVAWQPDEWGMPSDAATAPQGFWIRRPWSSAETCPTAATDDSALGTAPITLPGQTLAIVGFTAEPLKPGSAYEAVIRIPRDKLNMAQGLRARISGRIDRFPGDGAIRCVQPAGIEQQPVCAVAAVFDELVVDNPATGETVATWTIGKIGGTAKPPA